MGRKIVKPWLVVLYIWHHLYIGQVPFLACRSQLVNPQRLRLWWVFMNGLGIHVIAPQTPYSNDILDSMIVILGSETVVGDSVGKVPSPRDLNWSADGWYITSPSMYIHSGSQNLSCPSILMMSFNFFSGPLLCIMDVLLAADWYVCNCLWLLPGMKFII